MDYKEDSVDPFSTCQNEFEKNDDFGCEEDTGLEGLFVAIHDCFHDNMIDVSILSSLSNLFQSQHQFDFKFKSLQIGTILFEILTTSSDNNIKKCAFDCIIAIMSQKDQRYAAEMEKHQLEEAIKHFLDKGKFVEESFTLLKYIIAISEYHFLHCLDVIPFSSLLKYLQNFKSDHLKANHIFSYIAKTLNYNLTNDFLNNIFEIIKSSLSDGPYEGIFEIIRVLMTKDCFHTMQKSIELIKRLNSMLEIIPENCLPVALSLIGDPQTDLDFEPNIEFIVSAMRNEEGSNLSVRTSAMFCLSGLIDKNPEIANIAFGLDIIPILLDTDYQKSFENNEKMILLSKLIINSNSTLHFDLLNSEYFHYLIDSLDSGPYDEIMAAIITIVNSVLNEKGLNEVLQLQNEDDVLDIIEKAIEEGSEQTSEMASHLISQIPHE